MLRFALILASSAGFCFILLTVFRVATDVGLLRTQFPHVLYDAKTDTATIEIRKSRPPGWTALKDVSVLARDAIVISEDAAFWTHNGFDWNQMWDAFETNLKKGRFARGGSTITQQVIKNVYLSKEKTILRKVKEAVLTMRIERHVSKRRILEVYLNIAEFAPGVFGIGNAARFYFGKPAFALNAKEGAFLAMLLPSPKRYGASFRKKALSPFARGMIRSILGKLAAVGRLNGMSVDNAMSVPLAFEQGPPALDAPVDQPVDDEDEAPSGDEAPAEPAA